MDLSPRKALSFFSRLKAIECTVAGYQTIVTKQVDGMARDIFKALKTKPPDKFIQKHHVTYHVVMKETSHLVFSIIYVPYC